MNSEDTRTELEHNPSYATPPCKQKGKGSVHFGDTALPHRVLPREKLSGIL